MLSIQTNVNSLIAQQNLNINNAFQAKTINQLTSGYRINSSGDDAAGLAVANGYRNATAELTQGVANGNDAQAQLQIMDGGMSNISQILDRLQTLAMQSASGSFTGNRTTLNSEFQTDLSEINRQAQSIGLNIGGTFAQNMSVYLGAGKGSQSTANSVVGVNLANATVDAQSLGLSGVQAVNSNPYDLSSSSTTSVANIVGDAINLNGAAASATFNFVGAGFSNDAGVTNNQGVNVTVNLAGVSSTDGLIAAINSAISATGNGTTGADANLKAANITASIVTNSSGQQMLAFNSSSSSFQVNAGDHMSNALLGNFAGDGSSAATGAQMGTTITGQGVAFAGSGVAAMNFSAGGASVTLTVSGGGLTKPKQVVLNTDYSNTTNFATQGSITTDITAKLAAAGIANVTATVVGGSLQFATGDGSDITVSASGLAGSVGALGMSAVAGVSGGTKATVGATWGGTLAAGGGSELATATAGANELKFTALGASGSQSITISANNVSGAQQALTINLSTTGGSTGSGQDIQHAAAYINQQLQASGNATLQAVTAVVNNDNGVTKMNFVSTLPAFSVALGNANTVNNGLTETNPSVAGAYLQGVTLKSATVGTGGTANISTMSGAQTAVTALSAAVGALGSAQAQVGIGENQLNFALSLAQSQITNFSAAQSQIRDADVAQQAANMSKAQVLQQASIAAMAQANSAPQAVLSLLKG